MTPASLPRLSPLLTRQWLTIDGVLAQQWGFITTGQCLRLGVTHTHLKRLRQAGYLEGVAHGVMRRPHRIRAGDLHAARLAWVAAGKDLFPAERLAAEWPDYVVTATTALALHGLAEAVSPPQLAVIKTGKPRERSSTADVLGLERPLRWGTDVTMRRGLPVATPASAINALSTVGRDLVDDFATYLDGVAAAADDRRDREAILAAIASAT